MRTNDNKNFSSRNFLRKLKTRFSFHYVAYTVLTFFAVFSVFQLVSATTPNPGHPWIEIGDGVFTVTNNQTAVRTYTFPDANATILTTDTVVTVPQGGTGANTFTTNGILYGNGTGVVQALPVNAGATACLTQTASGAPAWGACGGAGIADGDKGDVTVSGSGAVWTIDPLSITNTKINDVAWNKITSAPTTLIGYGITDAVPNTRTINGYALSSNVVLTTSDIAEGSNLYFNNGRAQAALSGLYEVPLTFVSPLSRTGNSISIPVATTSTNGYLSSGDWNIFNGKQPLLSGTGFVKSTGGVISYDTNTYLTGNQNITLSGDVTGSGTTTLTTSISNATVTGKLLTGYVSGAGTISPTDSILSAVQKLNGNINALTTGVSSVFGRTGAVTAQSGDYTTAQVTESGNLYYSDVRARGALSVAGAPLSYNSSTGIFDITQATTSTAGYLSSSDWNTFNNKGSGSVTTVSVTSANGFTGSVSNSTTTPAITLATSVTGILKGDGTAISAATSGDFPTLNQNTTGNAATATALQTGRTINGTLFDGTGDITVTAAAGTLTGTTLNSTVTGSSLTSVGTISTGIWNGAVIGPTYGGTGVNNGSNTITLGGNLTTTGAFNTTFAVSASGTYTLPSATSTLLANNLGISGGTTLVGGTASGDILTLSTTANATKGKIIFGTASAYDEVNDRFGIGQTTPLSKLHITRDAIAATQNISYGILLSNTTAATSGVPIQYSPASVFRGSTWLTTSLASSTLDYQMFSRPTGGATASHGGFVIQQSLGGGAFSDTFEVGQTVFNSNDYQLKLGGNTVVGFGGGVTQYYGGSSGYAFYNSTGAVQFASLGSAGQWALTPSGFSTAATLSAWSLAQTWNNASGVYTGLNINITNTNSAATSRILSLQLGGANLLSVPATGQIVMGNNATNIGIGPANPSGGVFGATSSAIKLLSAVGSTAGANAYFFTNGLSRTATSGVGGFASFVETFAPTSGTAEYNMITLTPTINQTGVTGSPITRGLYVNPTLTAASDFRAIETASSDFGNGTAGLVIQLGRNTNATATGAGSINFLNKAGTNGYVWQDAAGNMRINTAAPSNANDTAGTVIGAQTSTRDTKQDITDYTDYSAALDKVVNAPLHTFRYIREVQGYGSNSPLAKIHLGYIADEVDPLFMAGNVIDQVSVNGLLLASIKELNIKLQDLSSLDTAKATSLGSLISQFLADQAVLIKDAHIGVLHIDDQICVDDVCATKEEFKALLLQAKGNTNQGPQTTVTTSPSEVVIPPADTPPSTPPSDTSLNTTDTPPVVVEQPVDIPLVVVEPAPTPASDTATQAQ